VRDLAGARNRALATAGAAGAVGALALAAAAQVGHWRDSRTLFERTLAVTRDNYLVHGFLARDHLAARRVDEAERHYREALRLRPRWLEPRLGLADVELARGRAGEALTVYEAVLREQPGHPGALARLGLARLRLGRFAEARAPLELALAAYPHAPALHLAFALLEGAVGDPVAALRHERAAVRLDPDDPAAANNLAWRLATAARPELRDPAEALRLSSRVVDSTGGSDPGALDTLAAAQAAGGDFASALRSAERALHLAAERGDAALVDAIRARRASYAAGRAWVEGASEAAR
jgi:tetratricopeptide (TPR) repeat protein